MELKTITTRIDAKSRKKLDELAKIESLSVSDIIRRAIRLLIEGSKR